MKENKKIRVKSSLSGEADVTSGIPQGSILGPILFTIFINDLPDEITSVCKSFADDTKIYNDSKNHNDIQCDITTLQTWSETWKLYFNTAKCKVLHVGKKNPKCDYYMEDVEGDQKHIDQCEEECDLGVTFDEKLSFDTHIQKSINKANKMVGIIKRTFSFLDKQMFLSLYKSLVRPHLEYANAIWNPYRILQET